MRIAGARRHALRDVLRALGPYTLYGHMSRIARTTEAHDLFSPVSTRVEGATAVVAERVRDLISTRSLSAARLGHALIVSAMDRRAARAIVSEIAGSRDTYSIKR